MSVFTRFYPLLIPACFVGAPLGAQDLHFSQPALNPPAVNPALTGITTGPWRAMAAYRDQWSSVPVKYRTFSAGADAKLWRHARHMVAGGLRLAQDKAGDLGLKWTQVGLSGSYSHALNESNALTAGAGVALVQRSVDYSDLRVKNQWDGEQFNAGLPTRENLASASGSSVSLSAGLNWHYQPSGTRSRIDAGAAAAHINRPELSFDDNAPFELPLRWNVSGSGAWEIGDGTDLVWFALLQRMSTAGETLLGAGVRQLLTTGDANHTALQFTLGTRLGDALIPAVQVERNNWTVGLSYDVNISSFDVATRKRGGFELAVVYSPLPVPPVKSFKSCPIF